MGGVDRPDLGDRHLPVGKDLEHECFEFFVTVVGDDLVGDEVRVSFQHEVEDGLGAFDRLDRCDFTQDQLSLQQFSQLRRGKRVSDPPNRRHVGLNPSGEHVVNSLMEGYPVEDPLFTEPSEQKPTASAKAPTSDTERTKYGPLPKLREFE